MIGGSKGEALIYILVGTDVAGVLLTVGSLYAALIGGNIARVTGFERDTVDSWTALEQFMG